MQSDSAPAGHPMHSNDSINGHRYNFGVLVLTVGVCKTSTTAASRHIVMVLVAVVCLVLVLVLVLVLASPLLLLLASLGPQKAPRVCSSTSPTRGMVKRL
jgi:hypothetical protein